MNKSFSPLIQTIRIGTLGRTHGIKGEISAHADIALESLEKIRNSPKGLFVFAEIDSLQVPFFVDNIRYKNSETILLKFRHLDTPEAVRFLVNCDIYLEEDLLSEETEFSARFFEGFTLLDEHGECCGTIQKTDDSTLNILLTIVQNNGTTFLLPLADDLVLDVNTTKKELRLRIPQGLLPL